MDNLLQKPRGTLNYFDNKASFVEYIIKSLKSLCICYDIKPIYIPTFEFNNLYHHSIGSNSEIVNKQLYSFQDQKNREFALRPEGTLGVIRTVLENKLINKKNTNLPYKYYYCGPMFRYERPQAGRRREFLQFGVEYLGYNSILYFLELIQLCWDLILKLLLDDKLEIKINVLGTKIDRDNYLKDFQAYWYKNIASLCAQCQDRVRNNPFRILDCKKETFKYHSEMPIIYDYLGYASKKEFGAVQSYLKNFNIPTKVDFYLVRGLDYYTNIVFEIVEKDNPSSTVIGGGSYNDLAHELSPTSNFNASGFAIGIERLTDIYINKHFPNLQWRNDEYKHIIIYYPGPQVKVYASIIALILRNANLIVTIKYDKNSSFNFAYENAVQKKYDFLIFINKTEEFIDKSENIKMVKVFNLKINKNELVDINNLISYIHSQF